MLTLSFWGATALGWTAWIRGWRSLAIVSLHPRSLTDIQTWAHWFHWLTHDYATGPPLPPVNRTGVGAIQDGHFEFPPDATHLNGPSTHVGTDTSAGLVTNWGSNFSMEIYSVDSSNASMAETYENGDFGDYNSFSTFPFEGDDPGHQGGF